jgi:hypothetical protein
MFDVESPQRKLEREKSENCALASRGPAMTPKRAYRVRTATASPAGMSYSQSFITSMGKTHCVYESMSAIIWVGLPDEISVGGWTF